LEIAVLMKDVPDLVEDLELDGEGRLAHEDLSYVPNEFDEYALEEALTLKEESGGRVTAVAVDTGDVDAMLYAALAKGADRAVKLTGDFDRGTPSRRRAEALAGFLRDGGFELILAGVQAHDDLDGQVGGLVAGILGLPYASVVSAVQAGEGGGIRFRQEYAGGVMADFDARPPVVLGVQSSRKPPRYVSVSRIRQVERSASIETVAAAAPGGPQAELLRLHRPVAAGRAEMLEGGPEQVAERVAALLSDHKLLKG
jgi:electron transfer flavoprotein beta subunit